MSYDTAYLLLKIVAQMIRAKTYTSHQLDEWAKLLSWKAGE